MADDQKTKTMDINDLVRELSKSSTNPVAPTPPLAPSSQAPRPSFPTPKPPAPPASFMPKPVVPSTTPPPAGGTSPVSPSQTKPPETPKPQFNAPLPTPGVKEYQSSIRTMNEDISKIRQGQQPMGVPVPRKVEQVAPAPVVPAPAKPTPSPQFKVPEVNLGGTQKATPMAPSRNIPSIPPAPSAPKVEPKSQINIPQEGQTMGNRNMLFIGVGVAVLVAGFAYWFFVLKSPAPEVVVETPTPTPTATPIPTLDSIFSGLESHTVCTIECTLSDFLSSVNGGTINGGQLKKVYLSENDTSKTITQLLDDFMLTYPANIKDLIGEDYSILYYGQKEIFDSNGQIKLDSAIEKRLVFVDEVKDSIMAVQFLGMWESEMANNLKSLLQFDPKKQANPSFLDNSYRGVSIRYKNFAYSDRSIDYAVVTALNGKSYLVVTGSREAMYATIDKLKGF